MSFTLYINRLFKRLPAVKVSQVQNARVPTNAVANIKFVLFLVMKTLQRSVCYFEDADVRD